MKLSILMPVYNERYLVAKQVRRVLDAPLPNGVWRELIIVDDGSSDGTREILDGLAAAHPGDILLIKHEKNQGKGAAIRTALARATGEYCLIQDADLEYDPNDYRKLLDPVLAGLADAVYGSRFLPCERRRVLCYRHELGNRLLTFLSNFLTNLNLTDMETCYKLVPTDILRAVGIESRGFGIEPEITAKLAKMNLRIYEVPINYDGRTYAEGKKITWKDGVRALFVMLKHTILGGATANLSADHAALIDLSNASRFNKWMAGKLRPYAGHRILEVGSRIGNLALQFLPRDRFVASDCDAGHLDHLRRLARRRHDMEVAEIDAARPEDFEPYREAMDTVLCLNVLEHISDTAKALANMRSTLIPGGRLLLLVPGWRILYCPLDKAMGHYRRFAKPELMDLLKGAGFEVERSFSFNRMGVVGWLINGKILRRNRLPSFQLRIYDSLVWLWRFLDYVLPWPGLSLVAVARKPAEAKDLARPNSTAASAGGNAPQAGKDVSSAWLAASTFRRCRTDASHP